jgi:acetyl esterase/lipase
MHPLSTIRWMAIGLRLIACLLFGGVNVYADDLGLAQQKSSSKAKAGVQVLANQRYCDENGRAGLCDVYSPASRAPSPGRPAVVVVHGGAWISGDKWTLEGYSRSLARDGFVAVTINYRLAPAHRFPSQLDDVRSALVWTKDNAERFSIDLNRIGVFGYSAGGHLSALIAALADEPIAVRAAASEWSETDARWQRLPTIRALCAGGPPCDFRTLPIDNTALAYFLGGSRRQKSAVYAAASPAAHVSPSDPVTQIIHGDSDLLVPLVGSRQFHQAQLAAGVDSRLEVMPDQGHLATFLDPRTNTKMLEFFREVLLTDKKP